jgi:glycerate-2-kinase
MNSLVKQFFLDTLEAMKPSNLIDKTVSNRGNKISINKIALECKNRPLYGVAVGKASRLMASALKKKLGLFTSDMLCITPDQQDLEPYCISSSHPVPDESSQKAADKLIHFVEAIPPRSIVFFLLSGGASALICKPANGIRLQDIQTVNTLLLHSGAAIHEINCVRKHLSAIKGGQLLSHFQPDCTLIDLVISDVPSDDLENIGSGPTIPDSSTFQDAYDTLLRYNLWERIPGSARRQIEKGLTGEVPETLKKGEDLVKSHHSCIIGSARLFAQKMANQANRQGFDTFVADEAFNDNVKKVAGRISKKIKQIKDRQKSKSALFFYGESTVEVSGGGKGGRNQELALRGAIEIEGMNDVTWLSVGTDGIDGPTDAAGAIVDGSTIAKAKRKGLDAEQFICDNNSYHFHEQMGTLLKTGSTGNNMMDVTAVLIGS